MENFPDDAHDDIVDAASGDFNYLNAGNVGEFTSKLNEGKISKASPVFNKEMW